MIGVFCTIYLENEVSIGGCCCASCGLCITLYASCQLLSVILFSVGDNHYSELVEKIWMFAFCLLLSICAQMQHGDHMHAHMHACVYAEICMLDFLPIDSLMLLFYFYIFLNPCFIGLQ